MTMLQFNMPRRLKGVMAKLPMMIDCEEFERFLVEYFEDGLTARQRFVFDTHLRFCCECREYLRAFEAARTLAREAGQSEVSALDDVPEDLIAAVFDSLHHDGK